MWIHDVAPRRVPGSTTSAAYTEPGIRIPCAVYKGEALVNFSRRMDDG